MAKHKSVESIQKNWSSFELKSMDRVGGIENELIERVEGIVAICKENIDTVSSITDFNVKVLNDRVGTMEKWMLDLINRSNSTPKRLLKGSDKYLLEAIDDNESDEVPMLHDKPNEQKKLFQY